MSQEDTLRYVAEAIDGLRFGSVEIVVHDGQIVQIERREKVRPRLPHRVTHEPPLAPSDRTSGRRSFNSGESR